MVVSSIDATALDLLSKIRKDLDGQDDWLACGIEVHLCLLGCLSNLNTISSEELSRILKLAQDHIKSVHHSKVHRKWRRLYTDVCILKGLQVLVDQDSADCQDASLSAIKDLDMAIIVCGSPGLDRLEIIHQEIALLQEKSSLPSLSYIKPNVDLLEEINMKEYTLPFCLASNTITERSSIPSLTDYLGHCHAEPFVVRNFASDWPAIRDVDHAWANGSYLARVGGAGRVVPVEIGWQYTEADWYQEVIPWQDFLRATGWTTANKDDLKSIKADKPRYMAQHNLFRQFPALEADIVVPDIVYSCPPAPKSHVQYKAPVDEDGLETAIINAWIGPEYTTTPAHFDPFYNAYVQVVGQKLVWVAPPDLFSLEDKSLLDGNSSTLGVFESNTWSTEQSKRAYKMGAKAVLGPGDLLILPPGWFHAMRSLSKSFSVSMWY